MAQQKKQTKLLQKLNEKLESMLQDISQLDHKRFNQSPALDKWSIAHIMYHLMLAEKYALAYVKKKLSFDPELSRAGFGSLYRSSLLGLTLKLPLKLKAPKGVRTEDFPNEVGLEEISKVWRDQRSELKDYLLHLDPKWESLEVYKHPLVGRLSIFQMLVFFEDHFDHHKKQIDRLF